MTRVRVKAAGDLKECLRPYLDELSGDGFAVEANVRLEGDVRVGNLLAALGLNSGVGNGTGNGIIAVPVGLILVNGKWAQAGDALHDGDVVALYPPVGGG